MEALQQPPGGVGVCSSPPPCLPNTRLIFLPKAQHQCVSVWLLQACSDTSAAHTDSAELCRSHLHPPPPAQHRLLSVCS